MQAKNFNIGDRFTVRASGYYTDKTLTVHIVTKVNSDSIDFIRENEKDSTQVPASLYNCSIEYYAQRNEIKIIERAYHHDAINAVSVRLSGSALAKGRDEYERVQNALKKAAKEFLENKTIEFKNGRLTFVSRYSGEKRSTTKAGCWGCPHTHEINYHSVLYLICEAAERQVVTRKAA